MCRPWVPLGRGQRQPWRLAGQARPRAQREALSPAGPLPWKVHHTASALEADPQADTDICHIPLSLGTCAKRIWNQKFPVLTQNPAPQPSHPPLGTHLHHGDVEAVHRAHRPSVLQLLGRLGVQLDLLLLLCGRDAEEVVRELADVHLQRGRRVSKAGPGGTGPRCLGRSGPPLLHPYKERPPRSGVQPGARHAAGTGTLGSSRELTALSLK